MLESFHQSSSSAGFHSCHGSIHGSAKVHDERPTLALHVTESELNQISATRRLKTCSLQNCLQLHSANCRCCASLANCANVTSCITTISAFWILPCGCRAE